MKLAYLLVLLGALGSAPGGPPPPPARTPAPASASVPATTPPVAPTPPAAPRRTSGPVTAAAPSPAPAQDPPPRQSKPSGSGTRILDINFEEFSSSAELLAAYSGKGPNHRFLGDYFDGLKRTLGPTWQEDTYTLESDPLLGKVVQMRQIGVEVTCPQNGGRIPEYYAKGEGRNDEPWKPYCVRNRGASGPTGNINFTFDRTINPYWSMRSFVLMPGWIPAQSEGSKQYKLTADTYDGGRRNHRVVIGTAIFGADFHLRGRSTVLWQEKQVRRPGPALMSLRFPVQPGSLESKPFELWTYYRYITPDSVHAGAWVQFERRGPRYGWLAAFAGGGPYPKGITAFRSGENMNSGVDRTQYLRFGPLQVWEGGDPWGLLAAARVEPE